MSDVKIALSASGLKEVTSALKGVRDTIIDLETSALKASQKSSKDRLKIYQNEANERIKIARKMSKELSDAMGGGINLSKKASSPTFTAPKDKSGFFKDLQKESGVVKGIVGGITKLATVAGSTAAAISLFSAGIGLATEGISKFSEFVMSDVVKPMWNLETTAAQMENASAGSLKAGDVIAKSQAVQAKYNIEASKAAEIIGGFADSTGSAKTAMELLEPLAQMSKAYGADTGQLSDLAAAIYNMDPSMGSKGTAEALRTQLAQGQIEGGKFTLKQVAGLGGGLFTRSAMLAGDASVKAATLGAAIQTGGTTGKVNESLTSLNNFIVKASELARGNKLGSGLLNKQGQIGDLGEVIRSVLIKTGGSQTKLAGLGFDAESMTFISQYMPAFNAAMKEMGGNTTEAAKKATATFETMRTATIDEAKVKNAASKVMATAGQQYETAINTIKMAIAKNMPAINGIVAQLAAKAPAIGSAASTLTRALLGLAEFILDKFNAGDTREKERLQREQKKQGIDDKIEKEKENIVTAQGLLDAGTFKNDPAMEARLQSMILASDKNIQGYEQEKKAIDAPEKILGLNQARALIEQNETGLAKSFALKQLDRIDTGHTDDLSKGFGAEKWLQGQMLSPETQDVLQKYNNQTMDIQDRNKKEADDAGLAKSSEQLAKAAAATQIIADSLGDIKKNLPMAVEK